MVYINSIHVNKSRLQNRIITLPAICWINNNCSRSKSLTRWSGEYDAKITSGRIKYPNLTIPFISPVQLLIDPVPSKASCMRMMYIYMYYTLSYIHVVLLYEPARNTESYILALDSNFHFPLLKMQKLQINE